ncbi:hypothetical protein FZ103_00145 [Streptomonospora sp. PA3]|uniref:hypothetical protein n=1 Tax=Streptomonospora sp. PA3 TaxID=2607326 RepID=UPI0012DE6024|nr:hypothetical protein [Streptomonospora sp. PA3]MUL39604.1 hypothetical protein [Streptomonospora sp. PA3]
MIGVDVSQMPPLPEGERTRGQTGEQLAAELRHHVIEHAITHAPRSQQTALGPSEIGIECARRIGYKLLGTEEINPGGGWLPTVGTAVHAWLAEQFEAANYRYGWLRFMVEQRVTVGTINGQPVTGTCDLYDRATATAIDFKIQGKTSLQKLRRHGATGEYRVQGHAYGRGWAAAGHPVERVAVWGLPRNEPSLSGAVFASEPYDESVATDALARVEGIASLASSMGAEALPLLPTADSYCQYCPFFRRGSDDLASGCPGHTGAKATQPSSVESLIA